MSIVKKSGDLTTLPAALLSIAKQHMRVDWAYDDAFITSCVARAVGRFEQINGVALNPGVWTWTPAQSDFCYGRALSPLTPVKTFTAKLADATNVTANYQAVTNSVFGVPVIYFTGEFAAGVTFDITTGFDDLPPPVLDVVLRNAAHLYEHREILIPGTEFVTPDLRIDATWWVPRA